MRFLALLALLLASCYQPTGFPTQPPLKREGAITSSLVRVAWIADVNEIPACKKPGLVVEECAVWNVVGETSFCTIYAFRPKDFNDFALLQRLGHEFLHCLDWDHQ